MRKALRKWIRTFAMAARKMGDLNEFFMIRNAIMTPRNGQRVFVLVKPERSRVGYDYVLQFHGSVETLPIDALKLPRGTDVFEEVRLTRYNLFTDTGVKMWQEVLARYRARFLELWNLSSLEYRIAQKKVRPDESGFEPSEVLKVSRRAGTICELVANYLEEQGL